MPECLRKKSFQLGSISKAASRSANRKHVIRERRSPQHLSSACGARCKAWWLDACMLIQPVWHVCYTGQFWSLGSQPCAAGSPSAALPEPDVAMMSASRPCPCCSCKRYVMTAGASSWVLRPDGLSLNTWGSVFAAQLWPAHLHAALQKLHLHCFAQPKPCLQLSSSSFDFSSEYPSSSTMYFL